MVAVSVAVVAAVVGAVVVVDVAVVAVVGGGAPGHHRPARRVVHPDSRPQHSGFFSKGFGTCTPDLPPRDIQ